MNSESVARNLLHHRLGQGLTQEQLAERAGVTARTIQRIEAATGAAHPTTLALLAGALAVPVQDLWREPAGNPTPPDGPASASPTALVLLHLLPLLGVLLPFANVLAPLFFWLYQRGDEPTFEQQGRLVVNFQVSVTLGVGLAVGMLLLYFPVGLGLLVLSYGGSVGMSLVNARRAWRGAPVHYPLALPVLDTATGGANA